MKSLRTITISTHMNQKSVLSTHHNTQVLKNNNVFVSNKINIVFNKRKTKREITKM